MSKEESITRKIFLDRMAKGIAGLALSGAAIHDAEAIDVSTLPQKLVPTGDLKHGMKRVHGISFGPDGHLWVVSDEGLARFTPKGERVSMLGLDAPGMAVTVDEEGFCYVAEKTRIHKFDPKGQIVTSWGEVGKDHSQFQYATGLAVSGASLYIADAGNRRIHRFAIDGDYVGELEGFHIPSAYFDCSVDSRGRLLVGHTSEHRVESYDANGEKIGAWGSYGAEPESFCGCCNPTNLAAFPDGKVVTSEKGIPRLKVYDPAGTLLVYLSPEELGVPVNPGYLDRLNGENGILPCHDGWPGMPVAIGPGQEVSVSIPSSGRIRFYRLEMA
jgi:hypothetical protein